MQLAYSELTLLMYCDKKKVTRAVVSSPLFLLSMVRSITDLAILTKSQQFQSRHEMHTGLRSTCVRTWM